MRWPARRPGSVPLGVDIGPDTISIVAAEASTRGFSVLETQSEAVALPRHERDAIDIAIAQTIRTILGRLATRERRCVLAAPAGDVVSRTFRVPPGMRRHEAERAAELAADAIVDWPPSERLVALDPIVDRADEMLLSIARTSTVERIVAIARAGGLRPVAVDTPACAWRRVSPQTDALLDVSTDRATLEIFGEPVGVTHLFPPRLIDDRLAAALRTAFVDARRDGIADVQQLAILGSRFRFESLEALVRGDGYAVTPVIFGDVEAPAWSLAYGLATWSVAPHDGGGR